MSFEHLPPGLVADERTPKPPVSPARLAANKANAARSTGPRTAEGKARSRGNALKHGLCATVVEVPGEDPGTAPARLSAWSASLNPAGDPVGAYLTAQAVRASIRLDRLHEVHEATVAGLARAALDERRHERLARVEDASRRLTDEPDVAQRLLRSTSEGCAFLIGELRRIKLPLLPDPPLWDHDDALRLLRLLGLAAPARGEGPSPLGLVVLVLAEYRAVVEKLRANERPQDTPWTRRYPSEAAHQAAIDALPELTRKAHAARDEVAHAIDREVAALESLRDSLLDAEAADALAAPARARFDASDRGKLLHRYEQDTLRTLLRAIKEARDLGRPPVVKSQVVEAKKDTVKPPASEPSRPARNEPRPPASSDPSGVDRGPRPADGSTVDVAIVPVGRRKRRRSPI